MAASQARLNQISELVAQWDALTGYSIDVPGWMVDEMANKVTSAGYVTTLYDVGRYMYDHAATQGAYHLSWDQGGNMPWAFWGMSATEYAQRVESLSGTFQQLTGQAVLPDVVRDNALRQQQGQMSSGQFQTWLLTQTNIKNQYGWLKYGLDFEQFQQQKQQMRTSFGRDLTDEEAVTQLTFLHAAQGPNVSASVRPTLTQQERKQAQTGVGQSVVR